MGIQVSYNMKDLLERLEHNDEITFHKECFFDEDGNVEYTSFSAFVNKTFVGFCTDIHGTYWFDTKSSNMAGRAILENRNVDFTCA